MSTTHNQVFDSASDVRSLPVNLARARIWEGRLSTWSYLRRMSQDLLGAFDSRVFEELIVERQLLWFKTFLINDPDGIRRILVDNSSNYIRVDSLQPVLAPLVGNGLVATEGDLWRRHRRMMAPAFDRKLLPAYSASMTDAISTCARRWDALDGGIVEMGSEMMTLTLNVIVKAVFSSENSTLRKGIAESVAHFFPDMKFSIWSVMPGIKGFWAAHKRQRGQRALRNLNSMIYSLIEERRQHCDTSKESVDVLDRLIRARYEDHSSMSDTEIRDQLMTLVTAGHETSAMAMMWAWYVLAKHPNEVVKILAEIRSTFGDREPSFEGIHKLTYTRMFVDEVLRMYPPVHSLGWRQSVAEDEVCGRRIPKGAIVTIVPWTLHRHKRLWEAPEEFRPSRFAKDEASTRSKFSYIPFSVGPHTCLGASFAITEMLLILAILLPKYEVELIEPEKVQPLGMVTLHSAKPMRMRVRRRKCL